MTRLGSQERDSTTHFQEPPGTQELAAEALTEAGRLSPESLGWVNSDFPGGPVLKNLPANVEDTGSIPGLGRFRTRILGRRGLLK